MSDLVKRRRDELKLKNVDIASLTGLSRSYIGNIVNETAPTSSGQYNLSPQSVSRLAAALQVSEDLILKAMNYLPTVEGRRKPRNRAEFMEALERLGLDVGEFKANLENYTEDDFAELLDRIVDTVRSDIGIKGKRKHK